MSAGASTRSLQLSASLRPWQNQCIEWLLSLKKDLLSHRKIDAALINVKIPCHIANSPAQSQNVSAVHLFLLAGLITSMEELAVLSPLWLKELQEHFARHPNGHQICPWSLIPLYVGLVEATSSRGHSDPSNLVHLAVLEDLGWSIFEVVEKTNRDIIDDSLLGIVREVMLKRQVHHRVSIQNLDIILIPVSSNGHSSLIAIYPHQRKWVHHDTNVDLFHHLFPLSAQSLRLGRFCALFVHQWHDQETGRSSPLAQNIRFEEVHTRMPDQGEGLHCVVFTLLAMKWLLQKPIMPDAPFAWSIRDIPAMRKVIASEILLGSLSGMYSEQQEQLAFEQFKLRNSLTSSSQGVWGSSSPLVGRYPLA